MGLIFQYEQYLHPLNRGLVLVYFDDCDFSGLDKGYRVCSSDNLWFFPLGFEVDSSFVPFLNGSWYSVHRADFFHEGSRDSSRKEVDECIIIVDFTEGCIVFELRYVISKL